MSVSRRSSGDCSDLRRRSDVPALRERFNTKSLGRPYALPLLLRGSTGDGERDAARTVTVPPALLRRLTPTYALRRLLPGNVVCSVVAADERTRTRVSESLSSELTVERVPMS